MSCGVGRRRGSDPMLLWLWRRPVATASVRPLAWEPPYAMGAALKRQKEKRKKKEMRFVHVLAWQVKTAKPHRNAKIFNKHTQSLRPKSKLSAQSSYLRLDTNSRDAEIAWNASNISNFLWTFFFLTFFRSATSASLTVHLIITIRKHLEPRLLRLGNSAGVKNKVGSEAMRLVSWCS